MKTPGDGKHASWELTQEDVRQIWAEALLHYKAGEPLHLNNELAGMALKEQQIAMEVESGKAWCVTIWMMLLPENWDRMELYDRRNYICGSEFGGSREPGVRRRERVCNMKSGVNVSEGAREPETAGCQ